MENLAASEANNSTFTEESLFIPFYQDTLHLKRFCGNKQGPVVFMLHGSLENGTIFYSQTGKGLAPFLAKNGCDVFVADLRGRGLSKPPISKHSAYGLTEAIKEEIPAFIVEIQKIRGKEIPQHWIAHSWGGILLLSYYARYHADVNISSIIFFGTKRKIAISTIKKFWTINVIYRPIFGLITSLKGYVDMKRFGIGYENETRKSRRQTLNWVTSKEWKDEDGFDYATALRVMKLPPSLFVTAMKDEVLAHVDDVRTFMEEIGMQASDFYLAARSHGNLHDYDHITMLTHADAPRDHFQYVLQWLNQHIRR